MQDQSAANRARYDRLARSYDAVTALGSLGLVPRLYRAVRDALEVAPGATVLELGCGPGSLTPYLLEKVGADGRVIGIDFSEQMIRRARERAAKRGWHNARFECADLFRWAPAEPVDAAVLCLVATVTPDPRGTVARACSLLRPGGQLLMVDSLPRQSGRLRDRLADFFIRRKAPLVGAVPTRAPLDAAREHLEDLRLRDFSFGIYTLLTGRAPALPPRARVAP